MLLKTFLKKLRIIHKRWYPLDLSTKSIRYEKRFDCSYSTTYLLIKIQIQNEKMSLDKASHYFPATINTISPLGGLFV